MASLVVLLMALMVAVGGGGSSDVDAGVGGGNGISLMVLVVMAMLMMVHVAVVTSFWAAWYSTWFHIDLTLKAVVFSVLFRSFLSTDVDVDVGKGCNTKFQLFQSVIIASTAIMS